MSPSRRASAAALRIFIIGVGRGGAALAPVVAGLLFVAGASLPTVATMMGCGALVGAASLSLLKYCEPARAVRPAAREKQHPSNIH